MDTRTPSPNPFLHGESPYLKFYLKLGVYAGERDSTVLESWLNEWELTTKTFPLSAQQLGWVLTLKLKGGAQLCFRATLPAQEHNSLEWDKVARELRSYFIQSDEKWDLENRWQQLCQTESARSFISELLKLHLVLNKPEEEVLRKICAMSREPLRGELRLRRPGSLNEAITLASHFDDAGAFEGKRTGHGFLPLMSLPPATQNFSVPANARPQHCPPPPWFN
ncbi:hypothetical protein SJAG_05050 [Schizosaccharomyces japonicus yFS275]|uniref:Retrotransposon gag domain-containing protein n=1 Tax=Schizosaccharomyces japonicus (strain yFS275 / FY16936) TaxID=402676 RepID=B6K8F7_SCHJY|nr:hypothetical protein SJAG_05050 [Schizosaccharomyces japonicus yFS275]EEB04997.1 hypothetical protein SJAG_05050 [Schizosaccharomyces japonicus yFS275]